MSLDAHISGVRGTGTYEESRGKCLTLVACAVQAPLVSAAALSAVALAVAPAAQAATEVFQLAEVRVDWERKCGSCCLAQVLAW